MRFLKHIIFVAIFITAYNGTAQTVYTTKTGEKYHRTTCHYLKYSKKEMTLEKALELGYGACAVCKPSSGSSSKTVSNLPDTNKGHLASKKATASQCTGKTQSGTRCKRMTKNANGKCYQH